MKVNTSPHGIGATLWQLRLTVYVLCKIKSKVLSPTQQIYSATELECLGVITALVWFRKYLVVKVFTLICDHQPLMRLFNVSMVSKNK